MFMKDLLETLEAQARIGITHDQKAARVMLAAPEMLEALKATLEHFNQVGLAKFNTIGGNTSTFAYIIEQAIKKAEGKE